MRRWLSVLVLLAACTGAPVEEQVIAYTTRDLQVDHSFEATVGGPRLCASGANVYAVWHDDRREPGRNQIFFNSGRAGGVTWGESDIQLSEDVTGDTVAENADIACAGESVYVVWEDDRDSEIGDRNIYLAYSDEFGRAGTWTVNQMINDDPSGRTDALRPRVFVDYDPAVSPDKLIYFVWMDSRNGAFDIYTTRSTNGYNLLDPVRLDGDVPGAAYSARPQIIGDGVGGVYVAWEDGRDGVNDVYAVRSRDFGANWDSSPTLLDGAGNGSDAFGVVMAVDRESAVPSVFVAWHDDRNGAKDIYLNHSNNGGDSWEAEPFRIDADIEGGAESFYPSVSASDDNVLVAWHDDRDVGFDILVRRSDNGGNTWNPEFRLETDVAGTAHSLRPQVVRNADRVAVVWADYRRGPDVLGDAYPDLWYRTSDDGGFRWSDSDGRIDDDPQSTAISQEHQVVLAGPTVHTLWVDYRAGNADLWYRGVAASGPAEE